MTVSAMSEQAATADISPAGATSHPVEARHLAGQGRTPLSWRVYTTLFPKPFDLVASLLYLGALVLFFYDGWAGNNGRRLEWIPSIIVTAAIITLLGLERWEQWFYGGHAPRRISAAIFLSRMALIEVVAQLDNFSFSAFLYLVIPFNGFLYRGMRLCYTLAGLVLTVYLVKLTLYSPRWYTSGDVVREFLIFAVGLLFVITMALVVRSEMRSRARSEMLLAELEESHRQLGAYAEQVGELATTRERNRLARDIHDSLGHYLTVINVQLEKARTFKEARPDEAGRAIDDAKQLASEALRDVRRSVGALRAGPEKEPFLLQRALEELVEHTGSGELNIELTVRGSEEGFAGQGLMALYRAAQEGLTNIQKHSGASAALIEVEFGAREANLRVSDNGRGFELVSPHSSVPGQSDNDGYGLRGLEERVELLGGSFRLERSESGGVALCVKIPKEVL